MQNNIRATGTCDISTPSSAILGFNDRPFRSRWPLIRGSHADRQNFSRPPPVPCRIVSASSILRRAGELVDVSQRSCDGIPCPIGLEEGRDSLRRRLAMDTPTSNLLSVRGVAEDPPGAATAVAGGTTRALQPSTSKAGSTPEQGKVAVDSSWMGRCMSHSPSPISFNAKSSRSLVLSPADPAPGAF